MVLPAKSACQKVTAGGRSCHTIGLQDLFLNLVLNTSLFQSPSLASPCFFVFVPAEDGAAVVDCISSQRVGDQGSVGQYDYNETKLFVNNCKYIVLTHRRVKK